MTRVRAARSSDPRLVGWPAAMAVTIAMLTISLFATAAQARPAVDDVSAARATALDDVPNWCGHERGIVVGNWWLKFLDHNTEAGGRHLHYYYQFIPNSAIRGEKVRRC